jgi:hypothetical protein
MTGGDPNATPVVLIVLGTFGGLTLSVVVGSWVLYRRDLLRQRRHNRKDRNEL